MIELTEAKDGEIVFIKNIIGGSQSLRQKFMAFGLLPGSQVEIIRRAPLGDPLHIRLLPKFNFSLSKDEAKILLVERSND